MILGITGGVGCGKSTVLHYLEETYQAFPIECDEVARELQEPGGACYISMIGLFGIDVLKQDGSFDRQMIAKKVFTDQEFRSRLEEIVHPAVKKRVTELIRLHEDRQLIVVEAALLLEDHYDEICDEIWYVYSDEESRRKRLRESRNYSDEKITEIFQSQRSEESFREMTTLAIDNSGENIQNTFVQIDRALEERGIMKY